MNIQSHTIELIDKLDFDQTFIIDEKKGVSYTYNSFFSKCYGMAEKLKIVDEDYIFAVAENGVELCALFFATIMAGKKIVVVDPEKGYNELQHLIELNKGAYIVIDKAELETNTDLLQLFHDERKCNMKDVFAESLKGYDFDSDYLTTFTSGTTGETKGVSNSLNNLFGTIYSFSEKIEIDKKGTFLHLMPMTYMAGILNSIFMPFIMGYRIVIGDRFSVRLATRFWKTVEKYDVNMLWMSPMMLTLVDKVDRSNKFEQYCRQHDICFLIGTAPLPNDLRARFEKRYGVVLQASYGLSETLFISVETNKSIADKKRDNVGEILTGVKYRILQDGELLLSVPWMFKGYTNIDTSTYFDGEYYKTGDLAEIEDGVLSIVGRKKDLIIRGGLNISPKLIEDCIAETNEFEECSVFGRKNRFDEEEVCCAYVLYTKENTKEIEKRVAAFVIQKLGNNYSINSFIKVDSLPRNSNGKIDKNVLRGYK